MLFFVAFPQLLQIEIIPSTMAATYAALFTILCMIMDIRNYSLHMKEEKYRRIVNEHKLETTDNLSEKDIKKLLDHRSLITTISLQIFYFLCLLFFLFISSSYTKKEVVFTKSEGVKRGVKSVDTKVKLIHISDGWTKIVSINGIEYLVKNEGIKEVRNK
jgi:hypothetical protein